MCDNGTFVGRDYPKVKVRKSHILEEEKKHPKERDWADDPQAAAFRPGEGDPRGSGGSAANQRGAARSDSFAANRIGRATDNRRGGPGDRRCPAGSDRETVSKNVGRGFPRWLTPHAFKYRESMEQLLGPDLFAEVFPPIARAAKGRGVS